MKHSLKELFAIALFLFWAGVGLAQTTERLLNESTRDVVNQGYTLLQKGRESGEGKYYEEAEAAFKKALEANPRDSEAMNGLGAIHLNRHQFGKALEWGEKSLQIDSRNAVTYGILTDAFIELGQYENAAEMAKKMVNLQPDLGAYSRISYLRELHGDLDGAIAAMQKAIRNGSAYRENLDWCRVQLGHLYFKKGDPETAENYYREVLLYNPQYGHALAGTAKVKAAQENYPEAIFAYLQALEVVPIGEYHIALAEVYEAAGMKSAAEAKFAEAINLLRREKASGMDVDDELAALLAQNDQDLGEALELAQSAYTRRPTVNIANILAWCHYKNGNLNEAAQASQKALQLNTSYAEFYFHAGMIAYRLGDTERAGQYLEKALALNPHFSINGARTAREILTKLVSG